MGERPPETTELLYVPGHSWMPALIALGLAGVLAGLFVWWPYGVIGAGIALAALARLVGGTREDLERLPRRQRLTTAVLPAVPPRRPE